ncbi:MarR family transcriptional regulator [Niallia circulans]|uniref:MarR family transcriptional regulator n=1 Tax=Niallia circulans TaxID=1397 RepID=UPI00201E6038|nr:helix-turn-helix domain-containing protein [Niallia circulans]
MAKRLKLSKPTISALVDELVEEGWIIEKESKKAATKGEKTCPFIVCQRIQIHDWHRYWRNDD